MSSAAVSIHDLAFHYPGYATPVFRELNLQVDAGERFGLFGPNGAGKTTLMHCMTGLLHPDNGNISILDIPVLKHHKAYSALFGFVPQEFSFYLDLSPAENLAFFGAWYGLDHQRIKQRSAAILETLGLADVADKKVRHFSGGMKRRVNLAIGVIHEPRLLFLDEPTVGVDVQSRKAIMAYLKKLNGSGTTLIYTSHQLKEAEELCNMLALFDGGRIIAKGTLPELLSTYGEKDLEGLFIKLTGRDYRD